jgi:hypothetical protein
VGGRPGEGPNLSERRTAVQFYSLGDLALNPFNSEGGRGDAVSALSPIRMQKEDDACDGREEVSVLESANIDLSSESHVFS